MPLEPDPRFPDRPTHPDFALMSAAVIANDKCADDREPIEVTFDHLGMDLDSLIYMAKQRVLRASLIPPEGVPPHVMSALTALYVDAVVLGLRFAQVKQAQDEQAVTP